MTIPKEERAELRRWADDCIKHNDIDDVPEKVIHLLDALDEAERRIAELEETNKSLHKWANKLSAALEEEETEREEDNGQFGVGA